MRTILVVANETLGGQQLLERAREECRQGRRRASSLCVPRKSPSHGNVIYTTPSTTPRRCASTSRARVLREMGIDAVGEVGDPDPVHRDDGRRRRAPPGPRHRLDAARRPRSGWLRRDFVERISDAAGVPVEHIVTDIDARTTARST